ncbi:UNVERIFIED_CONTAM: hypothetical protein HHA_453330 [Hammondia hammondi]|eukprot:XP_008886608.1 hypothetical protein HHA_453330 [Hammondia hammondi]
MPQGREALREKRAAERRESSRGWKRGAEGKKERGEERRQKRARQRWAERRLSQHDGDVEAAARSRPEFGVQRGGQRKSTDEKVKETGRETRRN